MDNRIVLVSLIITWIIGLVLLLLGKKKFKEILSFFDLLPRYSKVSAIVGLVIFLPFSFILGYLEIWLGGGAGGAACEFLEWIVKLITNPVIRVIGGLLGGILCGISFFILIPLSFLSGFIFMETLGAALTVLTSCLFHQIYSKFYRLT